VLCNLMWYELSQCLISTFPMKQLCQAYQDVCLFLISDNISGVSMDQVLAFWTGAASEPPLGFRAPSLFDDWDTSGRPLIISFYEDHGRLPYASTCSLRLWLPVNVDQNQFNILLKRSLRECVGFGQV